MTTASTWQGGPVPEGAVARQVDGPLRCLDFGGPASAPLLVCLHGLGGSALNWSAVAPLLVPDARVVALDLPSHGMSRPSPAADVLQDAVSAVASVVDQVCDRPPVLLAHSLGGVLALLVAADVELEGLVLVAPPVPRRPGLDGPLVAKLALLRAPGVRRLVARRLRRAAPRQRVEQQLRDATAHPERVPQAVVDLAVQETQLRDAAADADAAAAGQWRAIVEVVRLLLRGDRFARRLRALAVDALWLQGEQDPLVAAADARRAAGARPDWPFRTRPDVGHLPHLEDPGWVADQVREHLRRLPARPRPEARTRQG